jgi:hypothetical protein
VVKTSSKWATRNRKCLLDQLRRRRKETNRNCSNSSTILVSNMRKVCKSYNRTNLRRQQVSLRRKARRRRKRVWLLSSD